MYRNGVCLLGVIQATVQSSAIPLPADTAVKLRSHLDGIINCLPSDLQAVLT